MLQQFVSESGHTPVISIKCKQFLNRLTNLEGCYNPHIHYLSVSFRATNSLTSTCLGPGLLPHISNSVKKNNGDWRKNDYEILSWPTIRGRSFGCKKRHRLRHWAISYFVSNYRLWVSRKSLSGGLIGTTQASPEVKIFILFWPCHRPATPNHPTNTCFKEHIKAIVFGRHVKRFNHLTVFYATIAC